MKTPLANSEALLQLNTLVGQVRNLELVACNLADVSDGPYRHDVHLAFLALDNAENSLIEALWKLDPDAKPR